MLKKTIAVQFQDNLGAKVFINPDNVELLKLKDDTLIDPDLREVRGIPTCFWKKVDNKVVKMNHEEMSFINANFAIQVKPFTEQEKSEIRKGFVSKKLFVHILLKEKRELIAQMESNTVFLNDQINANLAQTLQMLEEDNLDSKRWRTAFREEIKSLLQSAPQVAFQEGLTPLMQSVKLAELKFEKHIRVLWVIIGTLTVAGGILGFLR